MRKLFKRLLWGLICVTVLFVAIRFGPSLYQRFFSGGNTTWIRERFAAELQEMNELIVYEASQPGQETAKQNAWLLGTVQEVVVPFTYHIRFVVDLNQSQVTMNGNTIEVRLPAPKASYGKLEVDEDGMRKSDLFYPLTPQRYAAIKEEIEVQLFEETSTKPEYLDAAWQSAVKSMQSLFRSVAEQSAMGQTCDVRVIMAEEWADSAGEEAAKRDF